MKKVYILGFIVFLMVSWNSVFAENIYLNVAPTLHPFTPTATATYTITPTRTYIPATITLRYLPTKTIPIATPIPEKNCNLKITKDCRQYLPIIWKHNQRSGE